MESKNNAEKIDKYLLGEMADNERQIFEGEMKKDFSLKEEVEVNQTLIKGIQSYHRKELFFKDLGDILTSPTQPIEIKKNAKVRRIGFIPRILAIAACVLILIIGGINFLNSPNYIDTLEKDFIVYNEDDVQYLIGSQGATSGSNTGVKLLQVGVNQYLKKEYEQAKLSLSEFSNQTESGEALRTFSDFYLSQIAMINKDYSAAIELLSLEKAFGYTIEDPTRWTLAVANLLKKQPNKEVAKKYLEGIPKKSSYFEDAQKLIEKIK